MPRSKSFYNLYVVVAWKYPGIDILSPVIDNLEVAKRTADLERAKDKDFEHDILVLQITDETFYVGKLHK